MTIFGSDWDVVSDCGEWPLPRKMSAEERAPWDKLFALGFAVLAKPVKPAAAALGDGAVVVKPK